MAAAALVVPLRVATGVMVAATGVMAVVAEATTAEGINNPIL
jgi:hypothetical protein